MQRNLCTSAEHSSAVAARASDVKRYAWRSDVIEHLPVPHKNSKEEAHREGGCKARLPSFRLTSKTRIVTKQIDRVGSRRSSEGRQIAPVPAQVIGVSDLEASNESRKSTS